jgi:hypothetical protein
MVYPSLRSKIIYNHAVMLPLSLLYFRICARIAYKIEGSRHKPLSLEIGRLKVGKKQAISNYRQFLIAPCIRKMRGAR